SLNEVGNALATETDLDRLLDLVARRLRELLGARFVGVLLPAGDAALRFAAVAGDEGVALQGRTIPRSASKAGRVIERGRSGRLARGLHDETGQALTSILLGLRSLEEVVQGDEPREATAKLRELVVATLQDVRQLAVELRPKVLDDFGLVPALERLTETFGAQTRIDVQFEPGLADERLPGEV